MPDIRPDHLIDRARDALPQGRGAPRQAVLRRGVSDTYYALFHHLTDGVARQALSGLPATAIHPYRRELAHSEMKDVSRRIAQGNKVGPAPLANVAAQNASARSVAQTFVDLQEERHQADYDHTDVFDARRLEDAIVRSDQAIAAVDGHRNDPGMSAYFALLALRSRWAGSRAR